jgi:uncharacterized protein
VAGRSTWIGKSIAAALGAAALAIALPSESEHTSFPLLARLLGSAIIVSAVVALYELVGHTSGRVVARFFPDPPAVSLGTAPTGALGPRLNVSTALLVLGVYFGTQALTLLIIAIATGVTLNSSQPGSASVLATGFLLATGVGGAAAIGLTARLAPSLIRVGGPRAIGLVPVAPRTLARAAIFAVAFAVFILYLAPRLAPWRSRADLGPMVQLSKAGGWPRLAWAFIAVILAPPLEEFFFRGVLLAGLARTWTIRVAGATTTILFVLAHLPYAARYWPAAVGVTVGAVYLIMLRLRTGSLLPGIAAHSAYNSVLVIAVYAARP